MSVTNVCPVFTGSFTPSDLKAVYPKGGIAITDSSITTDPVTKKLPVSALTTYIITLQQRNPPLIPNYPIINPGTGKIDIDAQTAADKTFLTNVQNEYCYYEQRYNSALNSFLTLATSVKPEDNALANSVYLPISEQLNVSLNSILQILELLNSTRVKSLTNTLQPAIVTLNSQIASASNSIQAQYALLNSKDAVIETQKEMISYTKEKNEHVMNQIALFTVMNAFAIGGLFAIWRLTK